MGSGGGSQPQTPSPQEIAAQNSTAQVNEFNLDQGKKSAAINAALLPKELAAQHLAFVDPNDPSKGFTDIPLTPEEQQSKDITSGANAQVLAGLQGKLPVGDAATNDWAQAEQQLHSQLAQQYGPGYESSTGGARALAEFQRQKASTFDAVRTGRMTSADAIGTNAQMRVLAKQNQAIGQMQGTTNPMTANSAVMSNVGQGFANQGNLLEGQRQFNANYGLNVAQQGNQLIGSGIQGAMAGGGMIGAAIIV